ncbi:MAG: DNA methyltransferase [Dehalococcoidia bacterium]
MRLIETDVFPFEFLSHLAERESWRKEIYRPIYYVHKWWAKRLGSIFRGILLACNLPEDGNLPKEFYRPHSFSNLTVFDPFMGSGTTVGEAHKLGFTTLGRDINPVAAESVRVVLGPMDRSKLEDAFADLSKSIGHKIRNLYRSVDSRGRPCDVLYYFWVMQAACPGCGSLIDLFPSWVIARNAYPNRRPEVQIVCPACGDIFPGVNGHTTVSCQSCGESFNPQAGSARAAKATCRHCHWTFTILDAVGGRRPPFRLYGKLVLTENGKKEYLRASARDQAAYDTCSKQVRDAWQHRAVNLPALALADGHNTRQAMNYGFRSWRDFFNDRQLLALGWLSRSIAELPDEPTRDAFHLLFSGILEFNNMFASYKGEGTGAVRHMFAHHILKPERTPIEANVWGTPKSSGSFSNLFRTRLLRALEYRLAPTEVNGRTGKSILAAPPFSGQVDRWPMDGLLSPGTTYLSCGDSSQTGLPDRSVDLIVTDPPFFDNVHYSELADFFYAWNQISHGEGNLTTRSPAEVQDADADSFAAKLRGVFQECHRILKDDGLLVFTYHHSRDEGWRALAAALLGAGFVVVNSQPVKAEMSVAAPKSQAKEPIQLDIIIVCRTAGADRESQTPTTIEALECARTKLDRLHASGFNLSRNDQKVILYGQLLTTLVALEDIDDISHRVARELTNLKSVSFSSPLTKETEQLTMF